MSETRFYGKRRTMNLRKVLIAAALLVPLILADTVDPAKQLRGDMLDLSEPEGSVRQRRELPGYRGKKGSPSKKTGGGGRRRPRPPKSIKILLSAVQLPSVATVGVAADLGAVFIYNSDLFAQPVFTPENVVAFVSGTCTRTQVLQTSESGGAVTVGGGHCGFTYSLDDGTYRGTIEAAGEMYDTFNNTLAITGGSESFAEAGGSILLVPVYPPGSTNVDIFTGPLYYLMEAIFYIPYRKEPKHPHQGW